MMFHVSVNRWGSRNTMKAGRSRGRSTRPSLETMEERTLLTLIHSSITAEFLRAVILRAEAGANPRAGYRSGPHTTTWPTSPAALPDPIVPTSEGSSLDFARVGPVPCHSAKARSV